MKTFILPASGLVIEPAVRELCPSPYPGHPAGCPNFGRRSSCPPAAPQLWEVFNIAGPFYLAAVEFDLQAHAEALRAKNPELSDRQARCCLYWQGTARKALRELVRPWLALRPGWTSSDCPEALGLNVFATAEKVGLKLERHPGRFVYKVALLGRKR